MKKVLIFYASYGGGHLSAAMTIKKYLDEHYSDVETEIVDHVKYINKAIDKVTTGAYREMAKKAPNLWGMVYSDSQNGLLGHVSSRTNKIMSIKLKNLILEKNPDIIISTHPFSSQMVSYLKKKDKINCMLATILTDFASHEQWLVGHEYTDLFFVSNDNMEKQLVSHGIDKDKIYDTGIPVSDKFLMEFNKEEIFNSFDLDIEKPVILFFGGGEFGLGKDRTIAVLQSLIKNANNYQIVAVSGKNAKMKESFETVVTDLNASDRVKVLGYTDKVPELMSISSVVVTKPGGLTTSESLVSNLPMIIINPIPGQEEENAIFLQNHNVGIWIKKTDDIDAKISKIFSSDNQLEAMRENTKTLARPDSAGKICEIVLSQYENRLK